MIRFACPNCQTPFSAAEEHGGQRTTCKQCGTKFLIPGGAEPPPYEIVPSNEHPAPKPTLEREPSLDVPPTPEAPPADPAVPVELAPCPTCQAKMSVRPEDVGFDLQCPFCQTMFRGVAASGPAPATLIPEPEAPGTEIAPCPKCRAELTVDPADLDSEVECPFCRTIYRAETPKPKADTPLARRLLAPAPLPPQLQSNFEDDGDTTPIKMTWEKENDPDKDDDEDDYRPRNRKRRRRRDAGDPYDPYDERPRSVEPSNGPACLILGLVSLFCCFFVGFYTITLCRETITKVNGGTMEESAKPLAIAGIVLSIIGIVFGILFILGRCLIAVSGK